MGWGPCPDIEKERANDKGSSKLTLSVPRSDKSINSKSPKSQIPSAASSGGPYHESTFKVKTLKIHEESELGNPGRI
jgi:hypothetical protein